MYEVELNDDYQPKNIYSPYCSFCFCKNEPNMMGVTSLKQKIWFCSITCQMIYNSDNKLCDYTHDTTIELNRLRRKFYQPILINERKRKLGLSQFRNYAPPF